MLIRSSCLMFILVSWVPGAFSALDLTMLLAA